MSISMLALSSVMATATMASSGSELLMVKAALPETALTADGDHSLTVTITVADGWSSSTAGIPKMFLQLDVPDAVALSGKRVEDFRALARNGFVAEPWERLVDPGEITVGFTLTETPKADDEIAVNVVAYLRYGDGGMARFARKRVVVPLTGGAVGTPGDETVTTWSGPHSGLQVGDTADQFSLPWADGTSVNLSDYKGKSNVIVTTYRAFW